MGTSKKPLSFWANIFWAVHFALVALGGSVHAQDDIVAGDSAPVAESGVLAPTETLVGAEGVKWHPGHYLMLYFTTKNEDMPGIVAEIAGNPAIKGVQRVYKWKDLEPIEGKYDVNMIRRDLEALARVNKRLIVQIDAKSNRDGQVFVPSYLLKPQYEGGVYKCTTVGNNAAYWNKGVQARMIALVKELGRQLNDHPSLEAVNFEETSPSNNNPEWVRTYMEGYLQGMENVVMAAREAFPNTVVIQYINWPVKPLPAMVERFRSARIGVGGPDVLVEDDGLIRGSYPVIQGVAGQVPIGMAVQYDNYSQKSDNKKHAPPGIAALHQFARDKLKANYIFWLRRVREPANNSDYYADLRRYFDTLDWVADPAGGLETRCPTVFSRCME